jgi:hypothetical protein
MAVWQRDKMRNDLRGLLERYDYWGNPWGNRARDEIYRIMSNDWALTPDEVEAEIDVVGMPLYYDDAFRRRPGDKRRFRLSPTSKPV